MTLRNYITGYSISLALSLVAFALVMRFKEQFSAELLLIVLVALAVIQLFSQLIFFLHLGAEGKPRWHLITFVFAAFIVLVIVGGTIWIMYHLDSDHGLREIYPAGDLSPQGQDD